MYRLQFENLSNGVAGEEIFDTELGAISWVRDQSLICEPVSLTGPDKAVVDAKEIKIRAARLAAGP